MSQLGRISGQLLKENLTRNGHDLTFDDDLLYLDVTNRRVGIKKTNPAYELDVNGTTQTTDLRISGTANIGDLTITGETITSNTGILNLTNGTGDLITYQSKLRVDSIDIENNIISTNSSNTNLVINPAGSGSVEIFANTNVYGDIYATGNIRADGNITIGDANTDNITINADIASNIIPNTTDTYTLGNSSFRWKDAWIKNIYADAIDTGEAIIDGVTLNLTQGNIYYVASNGNDTNAGEHQNDPVATIKHALTLATAGDTVYIYPGTYTELFPLTVPAGVTVKGSGIRAVKIIPDSTTTGSDAFLLNGETTVEDLTIADFYSPGYAFKFATGMTVTSRSPYVRNVTVITKGTTITLSDPRGFASGDAGGGAYIDGSVVNAASKEASMLFHSVTFLCPGVDTVVATNGVRIEWLNSFTYFSNRSMYLVSGATGFASDGKTRVKINNRTGTFAVGNTLTYYDTDGTTVLASGTIESIDGNFFVIDGKSAGWEIPEDRAGKTVSVNGDAKLSTAQKKFGTASLVLDGTGDKLTVASSPDFAFGTNDFTAEAWIYRNTATGSHCIFDFRSASAGSNGILLFTNNNIQYYVGGATRINVSTSGTAGAWNHVALVRYAGTTNIYLNGTSVGSYVDGQSYAQSTLTIGSYYNNTAYFNGYIDEVRITKDLARYTSNFVSPTSAFLGDNSAVLLLHLNGLNNSTNIIDDGITFQDIRTDAGGTASIIDVVDYADFGAEVRSISSAAVYGNYGIYGDGDGVIAYLIGQNLAYIGNGKETTNDPNTVIQANEVVELNRAKIYYNSVDHKGDFRVGDLFYVNQATGEVSFTNSSVTIGTSLTFDDGLGNITYIDATKIETGDFRISDNTVETLTQDFDIQAASNLINLNSDVSIAGNLDVAGDVTVGGNVVIGNQNTDTVKFIAGVNSDILPKLDATYDLGTSLLRWKTLFTTQLDSGDVRISTNVITTFASNSDLILQASGTGRIYVPGNNVEFDQNLTVNGTTYLKNTEITGNITQTGNVNQTGNITQIGDTTQTGNITLNGWVQFPDIRISGNTVETTQSNSDLTLDAAGTGKIYIPFSDVQIDQDLNVVGNLDVGSLTVDTSITSASYTAGDVKIETNVITTLTGNNDLELRAAGTGRIYVPQDNVEIDNDLTVDGTTNLADTNITGAVVHIGSTTQTGDYNQTGDTTITGSLTVTDTVQFTDIKISGNTVETTIGNNNLILDAAGTGKIYVPSNDVQIDQDLTVNGNLDVGSLTVDTSITSASYTAGDVKIETNVITTLTGNNDLELRAAGTGRVYVPQDNVEIDNNLTVNGITNLLDTNITGTVTHIGDAVHTGNLNQTGNTTITGSLTVTDTIQFTDIQISGNTITTTIGNNDLRLEAAGTGKIYIPLDNVQADQTVTITGLTTTSNITNTNTITSAVFTTGDIRINTNVITTTVTNSNLVIEAAGTGKIQMPSNDVILGKTINVAGLSTLADVNLTGTLTHIGNTTRTGNVSQTGNYSLTGNLTVSNDVQLEDINISENVIRTTIGNNNLVLAAAGTGSVTVPNDNVDITQNLTVAGTTTTANIVNSGQITSGSYSTGDILISGNTIRTTLSNSNLELRAAGTGYVTLEQFDIQENTIKINSGSDLVVQPNGTGIVSIDSTQSLKIPVGATGDRPLTPSAGMIRFNTTLNRYEGYNGTNWIRIDGVEDADGNTYLTAELTPGANDNTFRFVVDGVQVADLNSTRFNVINVDVDSININNNVISTTTSNTDLIISPNGTGALRIGNFSFRSNLITNTVNNSITLFNQTGSGYVKINSTGGFVIPVGTTEQRPALFDVGMMRFNTTDQRVEIWDGALWVGAGQGAGGGVSAAEAQDIGIVSAIIFG